VTAPVSGLAVVAGVLVLVASGCGKADEPSGMKPEDWASSFCRTVSEWQYAKAHDGVELLPKFQRGRNLVAARASLVELFDRAIRRTDTMLEKLSDMEPPAVAHGPRIQEMFTHGFGQLRPVFVQARDHARALPVSTRQAMNRGFRRLDRSYQSDLEGMQDAFSGLEALDIPESDSQKLDRAFSNEPACRTVLPKS
jgi:hypothetical protein